MRSLRPRPGILTVLLAKLLAPSYDLSRFMKFPGFRSPFITLLPCVGIVALGALTAMAEPEERTGSDAPHQERNLAKNEKKTALPISEVTVPAFSGTQKPVKKATAVKGESTTHAKTKDKKKAERQAKEKPKPETAPAATMEERPRYDAQPDDFLGSDAPHQERGSDPNKRAARLFILER